MNDENGSPAGRWSTLRSLAVVFGIVAAIATTVGVVFEVIERVGSDASPPPDERPTASTPASASSPAVISTPALRANGDEQFVQAGECVRNVAVPESPVYEIAACGPGTQRVVARIEQAVTDEAQADALCAKEAPGFADYHYSNWEKRSDFVDVVFCLGPA